MANKTPSQLANEIIGIMKEAGLSYNEMLYVLEIVKEKMKLTEHLSKYEQD